MPFKKGVVTNPLGAGAGTGKLTRQLKEILARDVDEAVQVIRDSLVHEEMTYRQWACSQVLDRVFGKARQEMEVTGPDGIAFMPALNITIEKKG